MPELPWRRRTARGGGTPAPVPAAAAAPEETAEAQPPGADTSTAYLRRAADCYLRAGDLTEAASCFTRLACHDQAADLYLRASQFPAAAQAYLDDHDRAAAAWIQVHYLADAAQARAILAEHENPGPRTAPDDSPDSATSPWRGRVTRLAERAAGLPEPAADQAASGRAARDDISALTRRVLGEHLGPRELAEIRATLRRLKLDAVEAHDWPAAYVGRELERLLIEGEAERADYRRRRELRNGADDAGGFTAAHAAAVVRLLGTSGSGPTADRTWSYRLVEARCEVAEGAQEQRVLPVLAEAQRLLADASHVRDADRTQTWAVAIAEAMRRYDQAALIFAAAVRGRRPSAAASWREWSARVLRADATLPTDTEAA